MELQYKNRIRMQEVDIAKGYGIILVIIGHILTDGNFREWIYSFHMPLFFFLAGSVVSISNFKTFIKEKIKGIMLPYLLYGIVLIGADFIRFYFMGEVAKTYLDVLFRFFIFGRKYLLWFLPCLFCTNILFWIFMQIKNVLLRLFFIILIVTFVFVYYFMGGEKLPWSFDTSCVAVLFFYLGYEYKKHRNKLVEEIQSAKIKSILVSGVLLSLNYVLNRISIWCSGEHLDMNGNKYGVIYLSIPAAIAGVFFVLLISILFNDKRLSYIGKNSMIYYALHFLLLTIIEFALWKPIRYMMSSNIPVAIYVIVNLLICIIVLTLINVGVKKTISYLRRKRNDIAP